MVVLWILVAALFVLVGLLAAHVFELGDARAACIEHEARLNAHRIDLDSQSHMIRGLLLRVATLENPPVATKGKSKKASK